MIIYINVLEIYLIYVLPKKNYTFKRVYVLYFNKNLSVSSFYSKREKNCLKLGVLIVYRTV